MNRNSKFLEDYEISFDNNKENILLNDSENNSNNKYEKKFEANIRNKLDLKQIENRYIGSKYKFKFIRRAILY